MLLHGTVWKHKQSDFLLNIKNPKNYHNKLFLSITAHTDTRNHFNGMQEAIIYFNKKIQN